MKKCMHCKHCKYEKENGWTCREGGFTLIDIKFRDLKENLECNMWEEVEDGEEKGEGVLNERDTNLLP